MELLDVYDSNGFTTGRIVERGNKNIELKDNEHIAVGVIYIQNNEGNFLMQKTSSKKGGLYSSTGGHVDSGETPLESIKREVEEELGINIDNENIEELGFLLYDMPLRYMFYLKKDIDIDKVVIQEEEVEFVKYMSADQINELINKKMITESHGIIFKKILEYIRNKNIIDFKY